MTDDAPLEVAAHPVLETTGHFGEMRLGRIKPAAPPKLKLADYLNMDALPPRPVHMAIPTGVTWPMYGNDELGDCTWAAVGHMVQNWTDKAGMLVTVPLGDIVEGYWLTGDPPATSGHAGDPTDDGRVETDVLGYWRTQGIPEVGHKILAYTSVERHHVREASWLFGGVYIGVELPLTAQTQQVWDFVPDDPNNQPGSWGGHAVPIVGYDAHGFVVITWGAPLKMTDAFRLEYVDEIYAIITEDWLNAQGDTLAGFNLDQLRADLAAVTGNPAAPAEATGAVLPAEPADATADPAPAEEPASGPETQPYDVSVAPDVVHAESEDHARADFIAALVEDGSLVTVKPHVEAPG